MFTGINGRAVFTVDQRLNSKSKLAEVRDYKTDPMFSTVTTTMHGNLAIGSKDGSIRLYKQVGQNAKTLLPGMGQPIISVDVSYDGRWVLATTKAYLLIMPTFVEGTEQSGFAKSMGKQKPTPTKLQVSARDLVRYGISAPDFTAARFNTFSTSVGRETNIVTSTGSYLVTWKFSDVLQGKSSKYRIRKLGSKPVDTQYVHDNEKQILVTDAKSVEMTNKR
jgi:hypothetical protein